MAEVSTHQDRPTPRQEIDAQVRHPGDNLYTELALSRAADLLADLYATAERHGLARNDFRLAGLARPAIHAVQAQWATAGPTPAGCRPVLDQLAAALTERGLVARVLAEGGMPYVAIGRTDAMPPLGPNGWSSIWVGLTGDYPERGMGWSAAVDLPHGGAPGCDIVAPCDSAGIAAVADAIAAFAAGKMPNPFTR